MTPAPWRHFVVLAPYRPTDATIYRPTQQREALAHYTRLRDAGRDVQLVQAGGSIYDVCATLRRYVAADVTS